MQHRQNSNEHGIQREIEDAHDIEELKHDAMDEDSDESDDDDDGDDNDEVEEFARRYCVCKSLYKENESMIECTECRDWFHPVCIDMEMREFFDHVDFNRDLPWRCNKCRLQ